MNNSVDLRNIFQRELEIKGISNNDIQFVLSLINETDIDSNMYFMENSAYNQLVERDLWVVFEEINEKHSIRWNHSNEPLR